MSDPLAQFRRETATRPSAVNDNRKTGGKTYYEAYDKQGRSNAYTEIRCIAQPSQSPQSRFLLSVIFSADVDEAFTLIYSFLAVEIKGRNLSEVRQAIQRGQCGWIQEYDETLFALPVRGEPAIESVRFIGGEKLDDILSAYRGKKT